MSEANMWKTMRNGMRNVWGVHQRFEDRIAKGIPDVGYALSGGGTGWIELKYSAKPAKGTRVQVLPHFTAEQRLFLEEWPDTFLFWRVENDWFLFKDQFSLIGKVPHESLFSIAFAYWKGRVVWSEVGKALSVSPSITSASPLVIPKIG